MIDPLEAVIQLLLSDTALSSIVEGRIAAKHKFGIEPAATSPTQSFAWPKPSKAIQIQTVSGGKPELSVAWQQPRLQVNCYGESPLEAMRVYKALVIASKRHIHRVIVDTNSGLAMVYWLVMDGTPNPFLDPDIKIDYVQVYMKAAVHEDALDEQPR